MKVINKFLTLLVLAVPFVGCSSSNDDVAVIKVELDKPAITLMVGTPGQLTATVSPKEATDKTVTWSSDKNSIVAVDATGKLTAVAEGIAVITVKAGDQTATCAVTVTSTDYADDVVGNYSGKLTGPELTLDKSTISLKYISENQVNVEATIPTPVGNMQPVIPSPIGKDSKGNYTIYGQTSVMGGAMTVLVTGTIDDKGNLTLSINAGSAGIYSFVGTKDPAEQ